MGAHSNPDIVDDNIVFMYDTDDVKSYKGEPTTNYGPASFGDWVTEGTSERIATGNTYKEQTTYNCRTQVGSVWVAINKSISGLRTAAGSSGTVTMSCMIRNNNPTAYNISAYIGHDFSGNISIAANSDWQKAQWTVNQSSMDNDYVEFRPYTNNASIWFEMTMPMVEVNKGHATQFIDGTRSATQGLIDRTGTTTITLSDVSFDSNAQITFDGTDDTINTGLFSGRSPFTDPFTIEAVVKSDTTSGNRMWIDATSNGSNQRLYCAHAATGTTTPLGIQSSGWGSSVPHDTDYHHYVIVMDGAVARLYNNGEAHSTKNYTPYQIQALNIGGRNTYRWLGDIPIFKLYGRSLSDAEVLQNYNATKGRFQ